MLLLFSRLFSFFLPSFFAVNFSFKLFFLFRFLSFFSKFTKKYSACYQIQNKIHRKNGEKNRQNTRTCTERRRDCDNWRRKRYRNTAQDIMILCVFIGVCVWHPIIYTTSVECSAPFIQSHNIFNVFFVFFLSLTVFFFCSVLIWWSQWFLQRFNNCHRKQQQQPSENNKNNNIEYVPICRAYHFNMLLLMKWCKKWPSTPPITIDNTLHTLCIVL